MAKKHKWVPEEEPQAEEQDLIVDYYGGGAEQLPPSEEPVYREQQVNSDAQHVVTFTLPRSVIIALLDSTHPQADVKGAEGLGLLLNGELTFIGDLVLTGTADRIAIYQKMAKAK